MGKHMAIDSGLPKVEGLEQIFQSDATEDKGVKQPLVPDVTAQQQVQTPPETPRGGQVQDEIDWGQFKNPKDLLKSYKEIQGFTTRVSQENKQLKDELQKLKEESELRQFQVPQRQQPQTPKDFEQLFVENPEQAIEYKAAQIANTQRIAEVLEEKEMENPPEFQKRYAYVQMLARNPQYQPLSNSPRGVKKLFELADKARKDDLRNGAHESLKELFGEDVDLDKFKALIKKDQATSTTNPPTNPLNAYMPQTGMSTRTGADADAQLSELERLKQEAIKTGDVQKVAGVLLKQALLK
jgi:hypothetical protein